MKKRFFFTILALLLVIGILAGIKALQIRRMMEQGSKFVPPPEVVTTVQARAETWGTALTAVGSLAAVQGVEVSAELPGKVIRIAFEPGTAVKAGDLLLQQDISSEEAQLRALETTAALARVTLERYRGLLAKDSIAPATYDTAEAQYKQAIAQADTIRAAIAKKSVRAPFAGRLGVHLVNLGQILKEGEPIVSLQTLAPIFVNFLLPQQEISQLRKGLLLEVTTDALPGQVIEGAITAISPEVESATRNIRVQGTVANPGEQLRPGMFVNVAVALPAEEHIIAIPATAVLYAPYSDSVFVLEEKKEEAGGQEQTIVRQQLVRLGRKHGDFVAVVSGLAEGDTIVSSGVFKLRNGQAVVVDNTLNPEFKLAPRPQDD